MLTYQVEIEESTPKHYAPNEFSSCQVVGLTTSLPVTLHLNSQLLIIGVLKNLTEDNLFYLDPANCEWGLVRVYDRPADNINFVCDALDNQTGLYYYFTNGNVFAIYNAVTFVKVGTLPLSIDLVLVLSAYITSAFFDEATKAIVIIGTRCLAPLYSPDIFGCVLFIPVDGSLPYSVYLPTELLDSASLWIYDSHTGTLGVSNTNNPPGDYCQLRPWYDPPGNMGCFWLVQRTSLQNYSTVDVLYNFTGRSGFSPYPSFSTKMTTLPAL